MDIYRLNEEMLQVLGTQWYHSTPLGAEQIDALVAQGFLDRAATLLLGKGTGEATFAFKDPRLCRLLAFWQRVLVSVGGEVGYVLALRNPASIADSLQKRDGMDRTQSYLLWLSHTLNSVLRTNGQPRVLVNFDRLIQEPMVQIRRISQHLNLPVQEADLLQYADEFLDAGLRHNRHPAVDLTRDPDCPSLVVACYRGLAAVAADRKSLDAPLIQKRLAHCWKNLMQLRPLTQSMDRMLTGAGG